MACFLPMRWVSMCVCFSIIWCFYLAQGEENPETLLCHLFIQWPIFLKTWCRNFLPSLPEENPLHTTQPSPSDCQQTAPSFHSRAIWSPQPVGASTDIHIMSGCRNCVDCAKMPLCAKRSPKANMMLQQSGFVKSSVFFLYKISFVLLSLCYISRETLWRETQTGSFVLKKKISNE